MSFCAAINVNIIITHISKSTLNHLDPMSAVQEVYHTDISHLVQDVSKITVTPISYHTANIVYIGQIKNNSRIYLPL